MSGFEFEVSHLWHLKKPSFEEKTWFQNIWEKLGFKILPFTMWR